MTNRNIKLIIAYDGTEYHGWQKQVAGSKEQVTDSREQRTISNEQLVINNETQSYAKELVLPYSKTLRSFASFASSALKKNNRTIQGEIEIALETMHKHPVSLTGAGRTDAGVHAAGQAANFFTDIQSIPPEKFVPALNTLLPKDIRILEAEEAPKNFHARFSAVSRIYRLYFICGRPALPHESRYNLRLWRHPNIEILNAYGRLLLRETDCRIFAGAGDASLAEGKSTNRYIYSARFFMENSRLVFEIKANAFLRNMVRSIAGTFLFYEEKNMDPKELQKIIASGERNLAGPTLPPQGLFLWKADY